MPSFGSRVLPKSDADSVAIQYSPREFPTQPNEAAIEFVRMRTEHENPDFRLDRIVSITSGIEELEKVSLSERVEGEALERLKQLQEEAYAQGYDLGRDEGQESAYRELSGAISERIQKIDKAVSLIESMQPDLVKQNESALVALVFQIAKKIAMTEITEKPELILEVLRQATADAQDELNLVIRLSPKDLKFLETKKERLAKDFEFIKRAKFEESEEIQPGGCVIVTNYGQVDATVEKRLEKVWATLHEIMPRPEEIITPPDSQEE